MEMELHAVLHEEGGSYWAEVKELPGCFASGRDLEEIKEALIEAINLYLTEKGPEAAAPLRVDELKLVTA
jgi:predicted RNase H-like HicB family nuclease